MKFKDLAVGTWFYVENDKNKTKHLKINMPPFNAKTKEVYCQFADDCPVVIINNMKRG